MARKGLTVHRYKCIVQNSALSSLSSKDTLATSDNSNDYVSEPDTETNNPPKPPNPPAGKDVASSSISGRRGKERREKYSAIKKSNIIDEYEHGATQDELAEKYNINRSLVSKWSSAKEKEKIKKAATSEYRQHTKIRPSVKYKELHTKLLEVFQKARNHGHHVNFSWLCSKARRIYKEQTQNPEATIKGHVVVSFLKKYNIRMRAKQRNKKMSKESHREALMKWHATTREKLIRQGKADSYDEKWGRFTPEQRFNVDQSPLPFVNTTKRTYEQLKKGDKYHKVWISQPGCGLEKRQCTLQICVRAAGQQPRLAVIFRGKGKRISDDEKASWHKDVDVYFQPNAWADTDFSVKWSKKTLASAVKDTERFVLFADNLSAQVSEEFKKSVADQKGVVWYGLPNTTDLWQPVDAGYAQLLKVFVSHAFHAWLDDDEHADLWYGNGNGFSAKDRRVLITQWAGAAYNKLISSEYDDFRRRLFQKTGALITADGSDDNKISPEGLADYCVPPPCIVDASETLPVPNQVEPEKNDEATAVDEEGDGENEVIADMNEIIEPSNETDEADEIVDNEWDRCYDDELVGRNLKVLYENGWFTGEILYFNEVLLKYFVAYPDQSSDLVDVADFDDVEVILL